MKLRPILILSLLVFFACSKNQDASSTKANFDFTASQANSHSDLFSYYGSTLYDPSTQIVEITTASPSAYGGAFYKFKQDITNGFDTELDFSITRQGGIFDCNDDWGGDGLALVLLAGDKITVSSGGSLGYSGTMNSLAVEIDTWCNGSLGDPNGNHISIHTNYEYANDASEDYSIGRTTNIPDLSDESIHTLRVLYQNETLAIYVDKTVVLQSKTGAFDLNEILKMNNKQVYIGLTASTGSAYERHNVHRFKLKTL